MAEKKLSGRVFTEENFVALDVNPDPGGISIALLLGDYVWVDVTRHPTDWPWDQRWFEVVNEESEANNG